MSCSQCKYLQDKEKKPGKVSGAKYFCEAKKKYVNGKYMTIGYLEYDEKNYEKKFKAIHNAVLSLKNKNFFHMYFDS